MGVTVSQPIDCENCEWDCEQNNYDIYGVLVLLDMGLHETIKGEELNYDHSTVYNNLTVRTFWEVIQ